METPHPANMKDFIPTDRITGLVTYLQSLDWSEPWLYALLALHLLIVAASVATKSHHNIQAFIFVFILTSVYCAEYINEFFAKNHKMFTRHQYFDSGGLFVSVVWSAPLLLVSAAIVVNWLFTSVQLMTEARRKKESLGEKAKSKKKE